MSTFSLICLVGLGTIAITATTERVMIYRGLARTKCHNCGRRFGVYSAIRNRVVFRVMHVSYEPGFYWREPLSFMHVRSVSCYYCGTTSTIDARGNDRSDLASD